MQHDKGILLESGTNELEIVEFSVDTIRFGINVIKVREIINPVTITPVPNSHSYIEGIIELRGEVLPVVDVAKALKRPASNQPAKDKFIVTEFNQQKIVFHVHQVTQIHRISWMEIEKPSDLYQGLETQITGVVKDESDMILLLDFEKLVTDVNPEAGIDQSKIKRLGQRQRSSKRLVVAEDSPLLRKMISDTLETAGYANTEFFENGYDALLYLQSLVELGHAIEDEVQLVITDIEMPQMDGHHLTKKIKEDDRLSALPVIIFSSLITEDLRHKGKMVGAQAQVSKPQIGELVQMIDEFIL
ncbi:chemotaxis protein [Priestia flexa]|uniref:chemotaxis protein n=1 Tax=Priestia flexa TaxID=86664 RepID=UPI0010FC1575|nr:chemotaxis protein [Priestia flexa]MCG7312963.1 chemotaxis protein [Priestia flexa]QCS53705.1 chemotaxis protein CheV [Priestia flexa]